MKTDDIENVIFRLFCGIFGISTLIYSIWKVWQNPSNLNLDLFTLLATSLFALYMAADLPLPAVYKIDLDKIDLIFFDSQL